MSLYSDLNEVLTPYAQKIKDVKADLDENVSGLKSAIGDSIFTTNRNVAHIESGTDLDTILTRGTYDATPISTVQTLIHCPVTLSFKMIVMSTTGSVYLKQIILSNHMTKPGIYVRYYNGSTWSDWCELIDKNQLEKALERYNNNSTSDAFYEVDISRDKAVPVYIYTGGEYQESSETYNGTDIIKCPKYLLFNFRDTTGRILINFYSLEENEYVLNTEPLAILTSDDKLNYLGKYSFGNKIVEIPDGMYMQIAKPVNGDVSVYAWNGKHFGPQMSGMTTMMNADLHMQALCWKATGLALPGNTTLVWVKNAAIRYLFGCKADPTTGRNVYEKLIDGSKTCVTDLPSGYKFFYCVLVMDFEYEPKDGGGTKDLYGYATRAINLDDDVSCLCGDYLYTKATGRGLAVIKNCRKLTENVEWESRRYTLKTVGGDSFQYGVRFTGAPYSSHWQECHFLGWHISLHTFLNAANDSTSKFYTEHGRDGNSPGYGLVCSSFAVLADCWPYPTTNYSFKHDPQISTFVSNQMIPGAVHGNASGHCMIGETFGRGDDFESYTIYEEVSPMALRRTNYDFIQGSSRTDSDMATSRYFSYFDIYRHIYSHSGADKYARLDRVAYDLDDDTLVNGPARPYLGDRCVCTSETGVVIDIKDSEAQTLYVQKCTYSNGVFTATADAPLSIGIESNTRITIPNTEFANGAFYGFYTDTDSTMEYIEYHDVSAGYTYTDTGSGIVPSTNSFWYIEFWEDDTPSGETEIIPAPAYSGGYTYLDYKNAGMNPGGADGVIFFKGTLGAYCAPIRFVAS